MCQRNMWCEPDAISPDWPPGMTAPSDPQPKYSRRENASLNGQLGISPGDSWQRSIAIDRPRSWTNQRERDNTSNVEEIALVSGRSELCSPVADTYQLN